MSKLKIKVLFPAIILSILVAFSFSATAQKEEPLKILKINGIVEYKGKPVKNAVITISRNGQVVKQIITEENGKFKMKLEKDGNYTIKTTKKGYLDRYLIFSTYIPEDIAVKEEYRFAINMYKKDKSGTPESGYEVPLVKYSKSVDGFVYTENM